MNHWPIIFGHPEVASRLAVESDDRNRESTARPAHGRGLRDCDASPSSRYARDAGGGRGDHAIRDGRGERSRDECRSDEGRVSEGSRGMAGENLQLELRVKVIAG